MLTGCQGLWMLSLQDNDLLQRPQCPNPWNLLKCYIILQKGFHRCDLDYRCSVGENERHISGFEQGRREPQTKQHRELLQVTKGQEINSCLDSTERVLSVPGFRLVRPVLDLWSIELWNNFKPLSFLQFVSSNLCLSYVI